MTGREARHAAGMAAIGIALIFVLIVGLDAMLWFRDGVSR